jgi:hypothetical protein
MAIFVTCCLPVCLFLLHPTLTVFLLFFATYCISSYPRSFALAVPSQIFAGLLFLHQPGSLLRCPLTSLFEITLPGLFILIPLHSTSYGLSCITYLAFLYFGPSPFLEYPPGEAFLVGLLTSLSTDSGLLPAFKEALG